MSSIIRWRSRVTVQRSVMGLCKDQGNNPEILGCSASYGEISLLTML